MIDTKAQEEFYISMRNRKQLRERKELLSSQSRSDRNTELDMMSRIASPARSTDSGSTMKEVNDEKE